MSELQIKNLVVAVGGMGIINGLQMNCTAGQVTAIVGANGAGKTTLFNLINGFISPQSGEIFYHGQNLVGKPAWKIANLGVGRLFQDIRLFARIKTLDNVMTAFPNQAGEKFWHSLLPFVRVWKQEREIKEKALEILARLGVADQADKLAEDLSYGQQKLVAFGRLLASDADLLLLDEPTSGIGVNLKKELLHLIRNLAVTGKTVIVVEHNLDIVREIADSVHLMRGGKIVESGSSEKMLSGAALQKIYL